MKSQKKIWALLILAVILMVVLSGCGGVTGPKKAKVNVTISPNPVPYSIEDEGWKYNLILEETKGIGVTLNSLIFDSYNQNDEIIHTTSIYEAEGGGITQGFGSNYLAAFSSLQATVLHTGSGIYSILTFEGIDDNGNPIETTGRVNYLPK